MRAATIEDFMCRDCGVNTSTREGGTGDYYMVHNELWLSAGMSTKIFTGMLCRPCLSKRIGRPLTLDDYTDAPVNDWIFLGDESYTLHRNHFREPKPYKI